MRIYRSYQDLMAAVLEGALEPVYISNLMYHVRTSYSRLRKLVSSAISLGLLEKEGRYYRTSRKGKEFLKVYWRMKELLGEVKEEGEVEPEVMEEAKRIVEAVKEKDLREKRLKLQGRSRKGILAAAYYIAAKKRGLKVSCERLSLMFNVSANTIRSILKIMKEYVEYGV